MRAQNSSQGATDTVLGRAALGWAALGRKALGWNARDRKALGCAALGRKALGWAALGCAALGCAPELSLPAPEGSSGATAPGGEVQWARALGGDGERAGASVAVADDRTAALLGRLTRDEGVALDDRSVTPIGAENVFWARLAANDGAGLDLKRFGAFDPQIVNAIATDEDEGVLVAGEFSGTLEFGGAPRTSAGGRDGYVARLDAEGRELWLQTLGGRGFQAATGVAAAATGRVVVVGRFTGALTIGDERLESAGGSDVFVASFDADGRPLWSRRFGDGFDQQARAVAMDEHGNAVVVGDFAGTLDLGGEPLESAGDLDVFVVSLDALGGHRWSKRFGDAGPQRARAVAVDGAGDVVVGGEFSGTIDLGGGPRTTEAPQAVFVAKLDGRGAHRYSRVLGERGASLGQLLVDGTGDVIVVGGFRGEAELAGGPVRSAGSDDVFVAKLDPQGGFRWSHRFGGPGADRATGVAVDRERQVFVTGAFSGKVQFGEEQLEAGEGTDVFVTKLSP
ncbi:SBBP repeat-containing protein [Sorangium sp. So ce1024]|uniref:SBBP repeat-containing protein n=1 Tax=unclassified Sorangium TaxID=2621164 RepID=UPI003F04ACA7